MLSSQRFKLSFIFIVVFFFLFNEVKLLHSIPMGADKSETLQITYNVAVHNAFALNDQKNDDVLYLTNQREPLPIYLWAKSFNLFSDIQKFETVEKFKGQQLITAKYVNFIFLAILLFSIALLVFEIPEKLASVPTKCIAIISLFWHLNIYLSGQVNFFANDLHTGAWLCLLMLQFVYFFKNPTNLKLISIGLIYGLLCLTKATFFYSGIIVLLFVIAYQILNKLNIKSTLVVFLVAIVVTTPWLVRNYLQTGQTAISGRGAETFVDRTYEEIYNDPHFIGLWYAYSPDFLKPLATKLTGYGFEDRLKDGRLQYSTRAHLVDYEARKLKDENMAINSHFKAVYGWFMFMKIFMQK